MNERATSDPSRRDADIEVVIPELTDDAINEIAELLLHLAERALDDEVGA
jgi:hypothetical protein